MPCRADGGSGPEGDQLQLHELCLLKVGSNVSQTPAQASAVWQRGGGHMEEALAVLPKRSGPYQERTAICRFRDKPMLVSGMAGQTC